MPRPMKIIELDLEKVVIAAREKGKTLDEIRTRCNAVLATRAIDKDDPKTVSLAAVKRYLDHLGRASVAPAHQPQMAEANAEQAMNVLADFALLRGKLVRWVEEADQAGRRMQGVFYDPHAKQVISQERAYELMEQAEAERDGEPPDEDAMPEVVGVYVADWQARTTVASQLRETIKLAADLLGRIHDAEQVQLFQQVVMEAVEEADPVTAQRIRDSMRKRQSIRRAALLGVAA
jgi:hypothetical protein